MRGFGIKAEQQRTRERAQRGEGVSIDRDG
jgi:hypothetical protein